jgi:hypothetical protein
MHTVARLISLLALVLCVVACGSKPKHVDEQTETKVIEQQVEVLKVELAEGSTCEVIVDFGVVEPRSIVSRDIHIVNHTDAPIVLLDYETTCRCTTLDLPRKPIEPGGEAVAVLTFDSRGEWGSVGNFLDITTTNPECGFVIWMGATVE